MYYYPPNNHPFNVPYRNLKSTTLATIRPVNYALQEAKYTSYSHAMTEVAAMAYLIGKSYDPQTAYNTVESWEVNEDF